jgi:hypothetical protein
MREELGNHNPPPSHTQTLFLRRSGLSIGEEENKASNQI